MPARSTRSTTTSTSRSPPTRPSAQESGWTREQMLAVFADRGGDPDRPGKKDPLDCLVWRAERPGEPALDSALGRGRPGLARRVHGDGPGPARRAVRRPGRWRRPGLPPPRDVRLRGPGADRRAVRPGLRARRDGRLRRREDVEVQGQPGLRLRAAQQRRRPDGDPADPAAPPLPLRLGVDRRPALGLRRPARPAGARRSPSVPAPLPQPVVDAVLAALATDLDAPTAVAAVDAWVDATLGDVRARPTPATPTPARRSAPCWTPRSAWPCSQRRPQPSSVRRLR